MKHHDCLFEIGMEECPAMVLPRLGASLASQMEASLQDAGLAYDAIQAYYTPRRLALHIKNLAERQPDQCKTRKGPAVAAARDDQGLPTPQALGFARACGVDFDALHEKDGRLFFEQTVAGSHVQTLLPPLLAQAIKRLPIPKWMRWGDGDTRFIRPVHWVTLLYGNTCLETTLLNLPTVAHTFGHRFLANKKIPLGQPQDYLSVLQKKAYVLADPAARRADIEKHMAALPIPEGRIHMDPALLTEVTGLVEWPQVYLGDFDPAFLALPPEVLIMSMQSHQRYFPVVNHAGDLLAQFVFVSNIPSLKPEHVIEGNQRVLSARLKDALFFYKKDQNTPLASRRPLLDGILFQADLGSMGDKSRRIESLSAYLADKLEEDIDNSALQQAAALCKCDLLTDMVNEFPDVQGTIGRYYAEAEGLAPDVALAIEGHLKPRFSQDTLPGNRMGTLLALADRLDTLVGIFGAGLRPTGEKDPYALRRAANGVLRLCTEQALPFDLHPVLAQAQAYYGTTLPQADAVTQVLGFIQDRMKGYFAEQGISTPCFLAVQALGLNQPLDIAKRLHALQAFLQQPDAQALIQANKRVHNILKKQTQPIPSEVNTALLEAGEEQQLHQALLDVQTQLHTALAQHDYAAALTALATLKVPIDAFFDHVMVMTDDPARAQNRLALLQALRAAFLRVADVAQCAG